ncbi:MAG: class I SAM-dependent methyltransferase [Deltaproteobacteria bacterium]
MMNQVKESLKERLPNTTKYVVDLCRVKLRCRQEFGVEARYEKARRLVDLQPEDKVLVVDHCNYQTIRIASRVRQVIVCNISGVDRATQTFGPKNLTQIHGDICMYPLEANSFDAVLAIAVLEHIDDDLAGVRNVYHALKPDGRFIAYVPHTGEHLAAWQRGEYPDHVRPGYTKARLIELLQRGQFEIAHCELENGTYAAIAGDLYYTLAQHIPFFINCHISSTRHLWPWHLLMSGNQVPSAGVCSVKL